MVYRYIHPAKKELIWTMLQNGMRPKDVVARTSISVDAVWRVRRTFWETGEVTRHPLLTGSPRVLTSLELMVGHSELHTDFSDCDTVHGAAYWACTRPVSLWAASDGSSRLQCSCVRGDDLTKPSQTWIIPKGGRWFHVLIQCLELIKGT